MHVRMLTYGPYTYTLKIHAYTCIRQYVHAYMLACRQAYIRTFTLTPMDACRNMHALLHTVNIRHMYAWMPSYIRSVYLLSMHACIHAYIYTHTNGCMHAWAYTYILETCIHAYIRFSIGPMYARMHAYGW
jgi:hypothetical protein